MEDGASLRLRERFAREARIEVSDEVVERVQALYDRGRFVDAHAASREAGPLQAWSGSSALVLASRLAGNLGAGRLAALLATRARRADALHAAVACTWCIHLFERRGPMAAWRASLEVERRASGAWAAEDVADLLCVRALVAGTYRDTETSAALIERARTVAPDDPWPLVVAARVAELEDRPEEALAHAERALAMRPRYRPAVHQAARLLHVAGRLEEAVALLEDAAETVQSPFVVMQWFDIERESGEPERLLGLLDRAEALAPIPGTMLDRWIARARCAVHRLRGDYASAAEHATRVGGEWFDALASRLRSPDPAWRRVRLAVPAEPQAHRTCAPATLAALAAYLGRPTPQQRIAEAICYAGTSAHDERAWFEGHGFAVREFRVTPEAARSLLDGAMAFSLETRHVDAGHLQAVVGYDDLCGTLLLQDPGEPGVLEADAAAFLEAHRMTGPRGLVPVLEEDSARIEGLELPDATLYDLRYAAEAGLARYDRVAAESALKALDAAAPGHALGWHLRISLASFDGDTVERRRAIEALIVLFPADPRLLASKLSCLREAERREERVELLRRALDAGVDPASFRRELAGELLADARTWPECRRLLWSAHRLAPKDAQCLALLAELEDRSRPREHGLDLRRFASSLEDTDESLALAYCFATVAAGRTDDALTRLRTRFHTHGSRSSAPALTLAEALDRLARTGEALDALGEALVRRPADGSLLVQLARMEARTGALADARMHLDRARPASPPGVWLRADAALRRREADLPGALSAWREILRREPLALDAHREVAWLLAALENPTAAIAHLQEACERFPHHRGLASVLHSWVREADPTRAEALVRRMLEVEPADAWWRRELAMVLRRTGRLEEAIGAAAAARDIAPHDPASHGVLAGLLEEAGRTYLSQDCLRVAIRLDVDYAWGVARLVDCARGDDRKREELEFVLAELLRQTTDGRGIEAYAAAARAVFAPGDLRRALAAIRDRRPDLWSAWSELLRQAIDMGDLDEALAIGEEALRRFPAQPRAWLDLARIRRRRGDARGAADAARHAVLQAPDVSLVWLDLAGHLRDAGDLDGATQVLRQALLHDPLEPSFGTTLASLRHAAGDEEEAWRLAALVARAEPTWREAWELLTLWATTGPRHDDLVALSREVARTRPGEANAWIVLARVLPTSAREEALSALTRAIALDPRSSEAYDLRAALLAQQGRFEDARVVLRGGPWQDVDRPVNLLGREAWLLGAEGKLREAIAAMLPVVERDGSYAWGWARLADWAERVDDKAAWERAARALLRLAPGDPEALCRVADLEARLGRPAEAEALLREALARDPRDPAAGWRLLRRAWARRDSVALRAVLPGAPTEGTLRWLAQMARALAAALAHDPLTAAAETGPVLRAREIPDAAADLLDTAFRRDLGSDWAARYRRWLDAAVKDLTVAPPFARLWMRDRARAKKWSAAKCIDSWVEGHGPSAHPAIAELLDIAGELKAARKVVPDLILRHGERLRADSGLWGKVGYALAASRMHAPCVRWLQGGEARPDAEGWMLWNLVLGLQGLGRDRDAEAVSLAVVRRGLVDLAWPKHVATAAFGEALAGRVDSACTMLATPSGGAPNAQPEVGVLLLREMTKALCAVGDGTDRATANARFTAQRRRFRALALSIRNPRPSDRRRYAEGVAALASACGRTASSWQRRWPRPLGKGTWLWIWLLLWLIVVLLRAFGQQRFPR